MKNVIRIRRILAGVLIAALALLFSGYSKDKDTDGRYNGKTSSGEKCVLQEENDGSPILDDDGEPLCFTDADSKEVREVSEKIEEMLR